MWNTGSSFTLAPKQSCWKSKANFHFTARQLSDTEQMNAAANKSIKSYIKTTNAASPCDFRKQRIGGEERRKGRTCGQFLLIYETLSEGQSTFRLRDFCFEMRTPESGKFWNTNTKRDNSPFSFLFVCFSRGFFQKHKNEPLSDLISWV